jgi:predicted amidohydrolase YtcJ
VSATGAKRERRRTCRGVVAILLATLAACAASPERAPAPGRADLVVRNAKVVTLNASSRIASALAIRDGKIVAVGEGDTVSAWIGSGTRVVDAAGRTVVPGLIDSHIHAIRAGLTYATEVNWVGAHDIPEAMRRLRERARTTSADHWVAVAGGWSDQQFAERRRPSAAELEAAVDDHPLYVQLFYSDVFVNGKALDVLGIDRNTPPAGLTIDRDTSGRPTGWWKGSILSIAPLFDRLPKATARERLDGTRAFFLELNRLGVSGVVDPGGFNLAGPDYESVQELHRQNAMTVRVAWSAFAQDKGRELQDFRATVAGLPAGGGDEMLKFNGLGERVTLSMYNNDHPDEAAQAQFYEVVRWAAQHRLPVTIHWMNGRSVPVLLDLYERLDKEVPLGGLRWSIAHLDDADESAFRRMAALGVGWTMQDALYFAGDRLRGERGDMALQHMPPIMTALHAGVHVGAGTDAHRVASYNPFVCLQWILDGKTVSGQPTRSPDEIPGREQALRLYTLGSAWFSFDDGQRGSLEVGKDADFAILSQDILTVPVERIAATVSEMTVVAGKIVYRSGQVQ